MSFSSFSLVLFMATGVEESVGAPKIVPFSSFNILLPFFICFLMIVYVGDF